MLSLYRNETRMQKIGRFGVLIFLIFMFLFQLTSTGQNKKYFIITGKIVPEVATSESGIIEMSKSGAPITKITIPKHGRFRLELEYFNEYTLTFVLSQHFSKTIIVSTEIPQEVWERDSDFPAFPIVVNLFKEIEGIDKSFTLKASGKIFYGKQTDNFERESYFSDVQMAEQIETAKAQTSQVAKEAQGITKQEAQDLVVKQKNFDQLIKDADVLYQRGEYQLALIKYMEAKQLFPEKAYASDRIAELQDLVKALEITERQKAELEQKYKAAIARANGFFEQKTYVSARPVYEEALQYKPGDVFANGRIQEIDQLLAMLEKQKQFNDLIAQADNSYKSKNFDQAVTLYNQAKQLIPEKEYPQTQIDLINQKKEQLAKIEQLDKEYQEAIQMADQSLAANDLQQAKIHYQNALKLKASEGYPKEKLAFITESETNRLYIETVNAGQEAFRQNKLKESRDAFIKARDLKPSEPLPPIRIAEIDELIAKQMEISMLGQQKAMRDSLMKVRDEAFNRAITSGKEMEQSKQYQVAIQRYNEAISIKPDQRSNVQKMITALEDQLRAMESQNKQYQVSIEKADQLFGASKLEEAIAEYRNASGIKPMEEYPKKQIIDIQNIITQRNAAYDLAIKNGDNFFDKSDWQNSKAAYTEALLVKPNEAYPEKRLREIDQKIIDEKLAGINSSAENAAYNQAVAKAEKALTDNELTTAKMHFNVAHSLKPAETMPPQRIKEIDALIEQRNKERLAQAQRDIDEKYRQSISVADNAFREKTYVIARLRYQEAQLIKPDETYPKNQIALIDKLLNEAKPVETYAFDVPEIQTAPPVSANVSKPEESAQATETRAQSFRTVDDYNEAIRKADDSFGIKDYTVARFYYYKANELKPKEEYPINQIELIRKLVDSELSLIDRSGYDKAIAQADEAFSKQNYTIAKFYYYKALEIKSWEKYPKDRIAEILALTNSLLSEREEKEYRDMISKADEAYFNKDIAIARFYYNKANAMKSDENYPRIKLKDIQKLIDQDARDQKNIEYNNVIELADQALQAENFSIARFNYNKALGIKPDEKYPKDQLKRIKEALEKQNN